MQAPESFDLKYRTREITAWRRLALLKRMIDGMGLRQTIGSWALAAPRSNRDHALVQLIEQMIASILCGALRFVRTEISFLDSTFAGLFGWDRAAGHKAIAHLFQRFMQFDANRLKTSSYFWLFQKQALSPVNLDVDSTVLTKWRGEGGTKGYNPKNHGRHIHHPLLVFVSDWRLVTIYGYTLDQATVQTMPKRY
jgi:hypothetical protein